MVSLTLLAACSPPTTTPPDITLPSCSTENAITCTPSGPKTCQKGRWVDATCPPNHLCIPDTSASNNSYTPGQCLKIICQPGTTNSCAPNGDLKTCNSSGTDFITTPCTNGKNCVAGKCSEPKCTPQEVRCYSATIPQICNENGVWNATQPCPNGTECLAGVCENLCDFNSKVSSYVGCEYWAADLPNYTDANDQPNAIVVANISPTQTATLSFFYGASSQEIVAGANGPFDRVLRPNEVRAFSFNPGLDHSGTQLLENKAIRMRSDVPVIAYQYNPLHNAVKVYSNDGTVLLPTNAVGTHYYALSWTHRKDGPIRGFLTIINSSGLENRVEVTPSAYVVAGPGIPEIPPHTTRTFTLNPGDSLNLETAGTDYNDAVTHGCLQDPNQPATQTTPCPDLTGTKIVASEKITVFGGHQCANVLPQTNRCDHIESILMPISSWGTLFVASKFSPRAPKDNPEPDIYRLIATQDHTVVQTSPPVDGANNRSLNAGQWIEFKSTTNFVLRSDKPVMIAQYMVGSNWLGIPRICNQGDDADQPTGIGDPAMSLLVPKDQWRKQYSVLTPQNYEEDYLNIVALAATDVILDGQPVADELFVPVGSSQAYKAAIVPVQPGQHHLSAQKPFSVVSYGYACHVSYATPGGMNVEKIFDHF